MLTARHLICTRAGSATMVFGSRRLTLPKPKRLISKGFYTMPMGNKTALQMMGTINGCSYSQSTTGATIATVNLRPDTKMLEVQWIGGGDDMYPYLWLRDNCQCENCFHQASLSRRVSLKDLSSSPGCAGVKVNNGGELVEVQWTDGHLGTYNAKWLHERAFRELRPEPPHQQCRLQKKYWGFEFQDNIPRAYFNDLLRSNAALLTFLENLEILGVVLVSGVPTEMGQLHLLTKRIGRMKNTHYGDTFDVVNKIDPSNLAYTGDGLDMHGDMPYYEEKPGIQLLHCIKQFSGEGGETLLGDGFAAALKLRKKNQKYFDSLTQTMVDFVDVGVEGAKKFHACWRAPTIELDAEGTIQSINLNQMTRDSHFRVSLETAEVWYAASLAFRDILYDANNLITRKLQPADLLVFDNLRVLHGRRGYRTERGERILQGCYWEWDQIRSLRRVLHQEMTT